MTAERMTGVYCEPAARCRQLVFACRVVKDAAAELHEIGPRRWLR